MAAVVIWQPAVVQHAPGQGLGLQLVPAPIHTAPKRMLQLAWVVMKQVWPKVSQQAPGGWQMPGVQAWPTVQERFGGTGQPANVVWVQLPRVSQQAPTGGQGFGVQAVAGRKIHAAGHCGGIAEKHVPVKGSQQAPSTTHGLGLHAAPCVQLTFGGTGQLVRVVCVQLPLASQQAPSPLPMHGEPGAQVTPRVGTPPSSVHRLGSVG